MRSKLVSSLVLATQQFHKDSSQQKRPINFINIIVNRMRNLTNIVLGALVLLALLIVPSIVTSALRSHQVKPLPNHSVDSSFVPKLDSAILQVRAQQLANKIKALQSGSSCSGTDDGSCDNLKKEHQRLMAEIDVTLQNEVNQRQIYESKWNTTCQSWKNESERLLNVTISQIYELQNNSLKIQNMASQISQLQIRISSIKECPACPPCKEKICPSCPEGGDNACPDPQPCPDCEQQCEVCEQCVECPHCHDQDYNELQEEYTVLYRKFQECEELVEQYKNKPQESSDCNAHLDDVKTYLRNGLTILNKYLEGASVGSQTLKEIVKKADEKLANSQTIEESISIVPTVINGLAKELQQKSTEQKEGNTKPQDGSSCGDNHKKLLEECMDLFKKSVDKLKQCENKVTPFIVEAKK